MDFQALIERMDATTCAALRRAVELGKFPDGRRLTDEQRELCMEAVLTWEMRNLPADQHTGYIDRGSKAEGEVCDSDEHVEEDQPFVLRGGRDTDKH